MSIGIERDRPIKDPIEGAKWSLKWINAGGKAAQSYRAVKETKETLEKIEKGEAASISPWQILNLNQTLQFIESRERWTPTPQSDEAKKRFLDMFLKPLIADLLHSQLVATTTADRQDFDEKAGQELRYNAGKIESWITENTNADTRNCQNYIEVKLLKDALDRIFVSRGRDGHHIDPSIVYGLDQLNARSSRISNPSEREFIKGLKEQVVNSPLLEEQFRNLYTQKSGSYRIGGTGRGNELERGRRV